MNFLVNLLLYGLACAVIKDKPANTSTLVPLGVLEHDGQHNDHSHTPQANPVDFYEGEDFADYGEF